MKTLLRELSEMQNQLIDRYNQGLPEDKELSMRINLLSDRIDAICAGYEYALGL